MHFSFIIYSQTGQMMCIYEVETHFTILLIAIHNLRTKFAFQKTCYKLHLHLKATESWIPVQYFDGLSVLWTCLFQILVHMLKRKEIRFLLKRNTLKFWGVKFETAYLSLFLISRARSLGWRQCGQLSRPWVCQRIRWPISHWAISK